MIIRSVEAIPVRVPRARNQAMRTAGSPTPLDSTPGDYRWSSVFPALYSIHFETALVKVTLEDGTVGWGEAQAPLAPEVACSIVRLLLAPVLTEQDFDPDCEGIQRLWNTMYATMRVRGHTGGFMLDAISGVDLALWDLAGKIQQKPVWAMIPDTMGRKEVTAYHSGIPGSSAAERLAYARERQAEGFGAFKIFYDCPAEELFATVAGFREQAGGRCGLAVDALWRLEADEAIGFGLRLDELEALWLEAPLAPEDPLQHKKLANSIRTPVAIGESYRTRFEFAPFFREGCMRIAQPDLGRSGLTESLHIAKAAAEHGVAVVPHVSIAMGPQIAAAIHLAASIPNSDLLEYNPNVFEIANRHLLEPLALVDGRYQVPQTPGLGARVQI
ncbi:MAG: mandelate racemase/muconate lactonizing enzyme family protein [Bryobacterales bacterium]|nr:mandelate racemase/muconate lactonizing enzyme family protein [Bryobacterales bacterium]